MNVEFKKAEYNFDIDTLGKYFSALGNEATLRNKQYSSENTTDGIGFIEIYAFKKDGKRVIMFQVPAASSTPISWKGFPYGRNGESLMPLASNKIEQIKSTSNYDWSRQIIEDATIENKLFANYSFINTFSSLNRNKLRIVFSHFFYQFVSIYYILIINFCFYITNSYIFTII